MDPLSHGLTGALVARTLARRDHARLALGTGFAAALLPDADTLIRAPEDPLLTIEFHRHFSHSLLFSPLGALLAAGLVWLFLRRRVPLGRLYLFALPAYVSACLLDAATSYGTQLLWPLSDTRFALSLIAVVDPVYTLLLLVGAIIAWRGASLLPACALLLLAGAYLGLGGVQRERAAEAGSALAAARGHAPEKIEAKPSMANLLVWRTLYLQDGHWYVDAVRVGRGAPRNYPGGRVERFGPEQLPGLDPQSRLAGDIVRFTRLSAGYVALHDTGGTPVLGDIRYAMRPDGTTPLWGIAIDLERQEHHADFMTLRRVDAQLRADFLAMLRGRPLSSPLSPAPPPR